MQGGVERIIKGGEESDEGQQQQVAGDNYEQCDGEEEGVTATRKTGYASPRGPGGGGEESVQQPAPPLALEQLLHRGHSDEALAFVPHG